MPVADILYQAGMSFMHPRFNELLNRRERREVDLVKALAQVGNMQIKRTLDKHEIGIQLRQHTSNWQGKILFFLEI
jgi:hypothetical protein